MDTKAAIVALMAVWGVGVCTALPSAAQETETTSAEDSASEDNPLLNRVWVAQGNASALPGVMRIFLADGTLVSDSCWETYRLSKWQQVSETEIAWEEDGMTINAEVTELTDSQLILNLKLIGGDEEQAFVPASAPYVCPELPE